MRGELFWKLSLSLKFYFMKILKQLGIFLFSLLLILFICFEIMFFPTPFVVGKFKDEFEVKNLSRDSTFQYQRFNNWISKITKKNMITGLPYPFIISITGNTDGPSEVYLKYVGFPGKSSYSCTLPKGKIDTSFNGELYEDRAEIVYYHNEAKNGNLNIVFRMGAEVTNN
jgi:hypothetical protein